MSGCPIRSDCECYEDNILPDKFICKPYFFTKTEGMILYISITSCPCPDLQRVKKEEKIEKIDDNDSTTLKNSRTINQLIDKVESIEKALKERGKK